jgi:APA family basic amino acid/polyamine antiporter
MARDGYLPRWLAPAEGPPRAAIALQCALALTLLWSTTYETLLTYIGFTLGLSTAATVLGLVWLKLRRLAGLEVPGWPWVPAAFIAGVGAICGFTVVRRPVESLYGLLTMAVGVLAWRLQTGSSRSARPPSRS